MQAGGVVKIFQLGSNGACQVPVREPCNNDVIPGRRVSVANDLEAKHLRVAPEEATDRLDRGCIKLARHVETQLGFGVVFYEVHEAGRLIVQIELDFGDFDVDALRRLEAYLRESFTFPKANASMAS